MSFFQFYLYSPSNGMPNMNAAQIASGSTSITGPPASEDWCPQPYYAFSSTTRRWLERFPPHNGQRAHDTPTSTSGPRPNTAPVVRLLSWNIDFMRSHAVERMDAAINHLATLSAGASSPPVLLLQEMVASDLAALRAARWVREGYCLTDCTPAHWNGARYGTVTLVPRGLRILRAFRVPYAGSRMARDVLFVDIDVGLGPGQPLRVGNTHLESLVADPPLRPGQMAVAATWMHEAGVVGAVLGGDLNAIQPFDRHLPEENGLGDAYLSMGGLEDREEGFTWGMLGRPEQRRRYGCCRMDKFLFAGNLEVTMFGRFGSGVEVHDAWARQQLMQSGLERPWVTDHMGIRAIFRVTKPKN